MGKEREEGEDKKRKLGRVSEKECKEKPRGEKKEKEMMGVRGGRRREGREDTKSKVTNERKVRKWEGTDD